MRCNVARRRRASLARSPTLEGSEAPGGARRGGEVGGEARVGVAKTPPALSVVPCGEYVVLR
jgi:hypothetical protein